MLLRSNKFRLAAVALAALGVLWGTTALAASHKSAVTPSAAAAPEAATAKDLNDAQQDAGPARTASNAADAAKISNYEGEFSGQQ